MTDEQIEILYKSILDLKDFSDQTKKTGNIWLSDDLELVIGENTVEIILMTNKIRLSKNEFGHIINELFKQQEIDKENESREDKRKLVEKHKHELTLIADNVYRVEKEYLEEMFYARQVSVGFNSYKNQLRKIVKVLNNSGTILIEDKRINNKTELEKDLQWRIGLENLEYDLRK